MGKLFHVNNFISHFLVVYYSPTLLEIEMSKWVGNRKPTRLTMGSSWVGL